MRKAVVDIDVHACPDVLSIFRDAGVAILCSLSSANQPLVGILRVVVESDALPEECEKQRLVVTPLMELETYGAQRLVKLSSFSVTGPYEPEKG